MKWSRNLGQRARWLGVALVLLSVPGLALRADLAEWVRNIEATSRLEGVFFRLFPLPDGAVPMRRPPSETRPALTRLLRETPSEAALYSLRALEAERQLDFDAAEADWKSYAGLAADPVAGQLALADFYHRRLQPRQEVAALLEAARRSSPSEERLLPTREQRAWRVFERILSRIDAHALPIESAQETYRAWLARYPQERDVYEKYFDFLIEQEDFAAAQEVIATYRKAFPEDEVFPVKARAALERRRGSVEEALALYDRTFQPVWPPALVQSYFQLLQEARRLRDFLDRARAARAANPDDLGAAVRVFYYYQQQGNLAAAQQALQEFRQNKETRRSDWTAEELLTLARLSESVHNYNEAARFYYALYSLPNADRAAGEKGLAGLINVLLTAPEQPIHLGTSDLSFYRDVATFDPYPGYLNGLLSLLFNSVNPSQHYASQDRAAVAYFHRARADELLSLFDSRFPDSGERAALHFKRLQAYATYGENDGILRAGEEFLAAFPEAPQRTQVMLLMADAYARQNRVEEEFATYDRLLVELAARADHIPLGVRIKTEPSWRRDRSARMARSPEYARVLDRYIARLVSMRRLFQALALYRREIDRNPNDPGLYERLATFLEQNRLGADVEEVYRRAMQQFPDRSWHHRLARWYLRQRRGAEFGRLTREVIQVFSGSELEEYFREVVNSGSLGPTLYLQLNLFAHQRFPHNLIFVRNLLSAYRRPGTADSAAWERLLRQHWFYTDDLRTRFFEFLSREGRLERELEAVRASHPAAGGQLWPRLAEANPAAAWFLAEGELSRSHFEEAAPILRALVARDPTDIFLGERAATVHRSLAPFEPAYTEAAAEMEANLHRFEPRNSAVLTRIGEIYADRERFDQARPYWDRIAEVEPGKPEGYLEAATIYWDYFQFDDALRLIHDGRERLSNPTLYAYQAGAIYENRRDYEAAVNEYVRGALAGDSSARRRLLQLAKRPGLRELVEEATASLASGENPQVAGVSLRADVLQIQERRTDLEELLLRLAGDATSWEVLERIDEIAEQQGLDSVREESLRRQISLTSDPVERLRLRLALANFYEGKRGIEAARQIHEALYAEHPTILGVVRATVDFYWRQEMPDRAIAVLLEAARASYPDLQRQFTFEAARRATKADRYTRARDLLRELLQGEPFRSDYLAALAETYAREGDDVGLHEFYLETMSALEEAPLSREERSKRIAVLRRGLIPALERLGEHQAAIDQYIEIINRFAEDEDLIREAAFYAERHNQQERLIRYYEKTADDSPRDFRWPLVLARLQTHFEHFPEAIAAYARATQIRPDRTDLHAARAALEERLLRFEDAARSYAQLYELTYQDRHWMERVAEIRARQGQNEAAAEALRKALLEGRPERAESFFAVARRLTAWNLVARARPFAERGVELAGGELLAEPAYATGARDYARILTLLREYEPVYQRLQAARRRTARAEWGFRSALLEMARVVNRYYTPEERAAFQGFLERQRQGMTPDELAGTLLPVAEEAGLAELEARWRFELIIAWPGQERAAPHERRLEELQRKRMKLAELGAQLEAYWKVYPHKDDKRYVLERAARAYGDAGETEAELRVLSTLHEELSLSGALLNRFFELLQDRDPGRLVALAGPGGPDWIRDAAANFAIASGDADLARRAVVARGQSLPPVWTPAYTGLVGLHYGVDSPRMEAAFLAALGPGTIGERIGKPVDRQQRLVGDIWFYYGARYGEYLELTQRGNPDDYLPAELEHTPGWGQAYFSLAEYFRETGQPARALVEYDHTLELDPDRGEAHDRAAAILWEQGKRAEAVERWREALRAFARLQDKDRAPETFWANVRHTLENIGERRLLPAVRPEADQLLRSYVRRNGTYRVGPLLEGALAAASDPAAGVDWIVSLAGVAADPIGFLGEVVNAPWLPETYRERVLEEILSRLEEKVARTHGTARSYAEQSLRDWQIRWIEHLVDTDQSERARQALEALPELARGSLSDRVAALEIRLAVQAGTLETLFSRYGRQPEKAASPQALREAAGALRAADQEGAARAVLEFLYLRSLQQRNLSPGNFLGLAEIRLAEGDLAGALSLLRRMTLVAGEAFATLEPAADLLEKMGHPSEAVEFRERLVTVAPWDAEAQLRLAETLQAAQLDRERAMNLLAGLTAEPLVPYDTRAAAALRWGSAHGRAPAGTSGELRLLAQGRPRGLALVEQPFFYHARLEQARNTAEAVTRMRLLLGALEIRPRAEAPRLALLSAALEADQPRLGISALQPLLSGSGLEYWLGRSGQLDEQIRVESIADESRAERFLAGSRFTVEERVRAAREVAEAFERIHRPAAAELFLRLAIRLEPSEAKRRPLEQRVETLAAAGARRVENARRRPVIREPLEQDRKVRPRLEARPSWPGGAGQ
ncbi:MAG: hypothetical protein ACE5G6_00210 [Terriglobia bacterium]